MSPVFHLLRMEENVPEHATAALRILATSPRIVLSRSFGGGQRAGHLFRPSLIRSSNPHFCLGHVAILISSHHGDPEKVGVV